MFDVVVILFHFIMICVRVDYLLMERMNSRICKILQFVGFAVEQTEKMVLFCHSYCTKIITYFAGMYFVVELRGLTPQLYVTSYSGTGIHIRAWLSNTFTRQAQQFCWFKNTAMNFGTALPLQTDSDMLESCFMKLWRVGSRIRSKDKFLQNAVISQDLPFKVH